MFVYNFKESKLPNISNLKANIDTELFTLENQIKTTDEKEEKIYKNFINLSIYSYLSFENASILNDFNNAFSSSSEILEKLNAQKIRLESIQNLVNRTNFEEDFNENEFLTDLQELLEDYYDYKNNIQQQVIEGNNKLDKLVSILNEFHTKPANPSFVAKKEDTPPKTKSEVKEDLKEKTQKSQKDKVKIEQKKPIKNKIEIKVKEPSELDIEPKDEKIESKNIEDILDDVIENKKSKKIQKFIPMNSPEELADETDFEKEENFINKLPKIEDNRTLIISEKDNKVYLPYFATDLQQTLLKSDYENYDELIQNDYVFPLKKFKNSSMSRFKEGYRLMREKEYESFGTSFSFGLKLMHNYKLHPAVISACRNIDELNCFLDCLDEDSLNSFDIFDIKFDALPTKK